MYMHICMYISICVYLLVFIYVFIYIYIIIYIYMIVCIYIYKYVCLAMYIYIHISVRQTKDDVPQNLSTAPMARLQLSRSPRMKSCRWRLENWSSHGGFLKWRHPHSWMVSWKIPSFQMDENRGYPMETSVSWSYGPPHQVLMAPGAGHVSYVSSVGIQWL